MNNREVWPDPALVAEEVAPYVLTAPAMLGDPAIWARIAAGERTLGLLASARAPAGILLAIHDLAKAWRRHGPIVVSGFHAPAENEALAMLLRGPQPAVLVLARGLYRRPPPALRPALAAGRLLVISPFTEGVRRAATPTATARNRLVAALADELLIAYAEPGGKTEALAAEALAWGKPVYALDHPANAGMLKQGLGVTPYHCQET
jgi:predicted Rossmann fold nucleotide-binding protein DprA/Smf involved in DNA uptake